MDNKEKEKKQIPLRLSSSLWKELAEWARRDHPGGDPFTLGSMQFDCSDAGGAIIFVTV